MSVHFTTKTFRDVCREVDPDMDDPEVSYKFGDGTGNTARLFFKRPGDTYGEMGSGLVSDNAYITTDGSPYVTTDGTEYLVKVT